MDEQLPYHANVIRLHLGRLYYRIKSPKEGNIYFETVLQETDNYEATLLYCARSVLATEAYHETATQWLQKIDKTSDYYQQAQDMLTLNLSGEEYFKMVKLDIPIGINDTEMLNRAIYHKVANEISILKSIVSRILYRTKENDSSLLAIIENIEKIAEEIKCRRDEEELEIKQIPSDDYWQILEIISKTAHEISDFVNNELAIIESKTRRIMRKSSSDSPHNSQFKKLLTQLEITQTALSDLKAINEGIIIKYHLFKIKELFEKWQTIPKIENATINLDIKNGEEEFYGDAEKIKSAINELVENSLKHNANYPNLEITLSSQDINNPEDIIGQTMPDNKKYLLIIFTDNGKGIPSDKKDWIFQPLKTTSEKGKGSGLGLFILRKTLEKMNGFIRETGYNGAKFEIYVPYKT
ncbi:MAG: sensor histidine kinase [Microcystaceae cyanobacterium]